MGRLTKVLFFMFILISIYCCKKEQSEFLSFKNYIEKDLSSKATYKDALYLILPLNSCNPCIEKIKYFLKNKKNNNKIYLIIIAETNNEINLFSNQLIDKFNVIYDTKGYFHRSLFFEDFNPRIIVVKNDIIIKNATLDINNEFENMKSLVNNFYR